MKTLLSFLLIITLSNITFAQTTAIPDANFEQALIDKWLDSGPIDGQVLTSNINTVTTLNIYAKNINDLTGIEDFTALEYLDVSNNNLTNLNLNQNAFLEILNCSTNVVLTSLDVSQNLALVLLRCGINQLTTLDLSHNNALNYLTCHDNQLTSLDVSQNTALATLVCQENQLTTLDVSQNIALELLSCQENQLTTLDVSQNTALVHLRCDNNQLSCFNVKNGNNVNYNFLFAINNPNLTCIEVDDSTWSANNWMDIDPASSFSTNCNNACSSVATSINVASLSKLSLYPNPTNRNITLGFGEIQSNLNLSLTNALGQVVLTNNYTSTNFINFDIVAPKGVYFLQLETSNGKVMTRKIIKE
jgi:Leucine-rich repeat (LRR) protein